MLRALPLLLLAAPALAAPIRLTHQGRLLDAAGAPLQGAHTLALELRDGGGGLLFHEDFGAVTLEDGYFSVVLGAGSTPLDSAALTADELWVHPILAGQALSPTLLVEVPVAARSRVAERVDIVGGVVGTGCDDPGRIVYDTAIDGLRVCVAGAWKPVGVRTIVQAPEGRQWSDGTVSRSCLEYLEPSGGRVYSGAIGDGEYRIDVDADGPLGAVTVECDMDGGGWTIFHHDREARFRSRGSETPRSLQYPITYTAPLAVVTAARDAAASVAQYLSKECWDSLIDNGTVYAAFLYPPSSTAPSSAWPNRAECDRNDAVWRQSAGDITNKAYLPIIRVDNGDTGDASEDSYLTIGPLRVR